MRTIRRAGLLAAAAVLAVAGSGQFTATPTPVEVAPVSSPVAAVTADEQVGPVLDQEPELEPAPPAPRRTGSSGSPTQVTQGQISPGKSSSSSFTYSGSSGGVSATTSSSASGSKASTRD